jgi:hypothetical protein
MKKNKYGNIEVRRKGQREFKMSFLFNLHRIWFFPRVFALLGAFWSPGDLAKFHSLSPSILYYK